MSEESSDSSQCYYSEIYDNSDILHQEYVNKKIKSAIEKFENVEDNTLKYLLMVWNLLDYNVLQLDDILEIIEDTFVLCLAETFQHKKKINEYKESILKELQDVKKHLVDIIEINKKLHRYITKPISNKFVSHFNNCKLYYDENLDIPKTSIVAMFECLRETLNEECF